MSPNSKDGAVYTTKSIKWKANSIGVNELTGTALWKMTSSSFFYIISMKIIGYAQIFTKGEEKAQPSKTELNLINIIILLWSLLLNLHSVRVECEIMLMMKNHITIVTRNNHSSSSRINKSISIHIFCMRSSRSWRGAKQFAENEKALQMKRMLLRATNNEYNLCM